MAAPRDSERSGSLKSDDMGAFEKVILDLLSRIPATNEAESENPTVRARGIAKTTAAKAAALSGSLALAPGPAGWLTILPDLAGVWRLQQAMVVDIAAAFGKTADLGREQMFYCLFRHVAAHAIRDIVVRVGGRVVVRRVPLSVLQAAARRVGLRLTQRVIGRGIARWVPVAGAVGVGAYAYYDTLRVADTAIELFGWKKLSAESD